MSTGQRGRPTKAQEQTTVQVNFRLDSELLQRLDAHIPRMEKANPGLKFTRVDALRSLLTAALEREEAKG